ncbi:MAG: glutathione peroxidase [Planctomycetota bacterium]
MGGEVQELSDYEGKVVLIVNVASRCGLTPQYEGLQSLYEAKKDRGFEILGFPANDFGRQEPGSNESILEFCSGEYGVTFPMFEKVVVTGEDATPLYQALASQPEPIGGEPRWNFTKFLVDRDGRVVARFGPRVAPEAAELVEQVDALLGDSDS